MERSSDSSRKYKSGHYRNQYGEFKAKNLNSSSSRSKYKDNRKKSKYRDNHSRGSHGSRDQNRQVNSNISNTTGGFLYSKHQVPTTGLDPRKPHVVSQQTLNSKVASTKERHPTFKDSRGHNTSSLSPRSVSPVQAVVTDNGKVRFTQRALNFFKDGVIKQRRKELLAKHQHLLRADWSTDKVNALLDPAGWISLGLNYQMIPSSSSQAQKPQKELQKSFTNSPLELAIPLQDLMLLHPAEGLKQWRDIFSEKRVILSSVSSLLEPQPAQPSDNSPSLPSPLDPEQ